MYIGKQVKINLSKEKCNDKQIQIITYLDENDTR